MKWKTKKILIGVSLGTLAATTIGGATASIIIYKKATQAKDTLNNYLILDNDYISDTKEKLNVLAMGDSLVAGYNDRYHDVNPSDESMSFWSYADYVAKGLETKNRLKSYTNLSVSGFTTDTLNNQMKMQSNLKRLQNADFLMMTVGGNDILKALTFAGLPFTTSLLSGGGNAFSDMFGNVSRSTLQQQSFKDINAPLTEYSNGFIANNLGTNLSYALDGDLNRLISPQLERFDDENLFSKSVSIYVRQLSTIFHDIRLVNKHVKVIFVQPPNPFINWPDKLLNQKTLSFYKDDEIQIMNVKEIYNFYSDLVREAFEQQKNNIFIDEGFYLEEMQEIKTFVDNRYETMPFLTDIHPSLKGHKYVADHILQKYFSLNAEDLGEVPISPTRNFVPYNCGSNIKEQLINCMLNEQTKDGIDRNVAPISDRLPTYAEANKSLLLPILHGFSWGDYQFRATNSSGDSILDNPVGKFINVLKSLIGIFLGNSTPSTGTTSSSLSAETISMIESVLREISLKDSKPTEFAAWIYYHFSNLLKFGDQPLPAWDYDKSTISSINTTKTGNEWKTILLKEINDLFSPSTTGSTISGSIFSVAKAIFASNTWFAGHSSSSTTNVDLLISMIKERYNEYVTPERIEEVAEIFHQLSR